MGWAAEGVWLADCLAWLCVYEGAFDKVFYTGVAFTCAPDPVLDFGSACDEACFTVTAKDKATRG